MPVLSGDRQSNEEIERQKAVITKMDQLNAAIKSALEKTAKNKEMLLSAPSIFLMVLHPIEGLSVVRAVTASLADQGFDLTNRKNMWVEKDKDTEEFYNKDDNIGCFTYSNLSEVSKKDHPYYK